MSALSARVWSVLKGYQTMVLATADPAGEPGAAAVFYAAADADDGIEIVCTLLSSSTKLAHLRRNPRAAFFIGPQTPTCWLQGAGDVRIVAEQPERGGRIAQVVAGAPGAAMFVGRVPVTPVVIRVRTIKLTDLTGGQPPVETVSFGAISGAREARGPGE